MHRVFQIEVLVRHIYQKLDANGLSVMSRVQRSLGNTALDILWEIVDIETLLYLFPSGNVTCSPWGKEFTRFPSDEDWERYVWYSPRVKTLRRTFRLTVGAFVNFPNVLSVLRTHGGLTNLTRLEWNGTSSSEEFPEICMFLVPSLKALELPVRDSEEVPADFLSSALAYEQRVEVPLQKLIELKVSLRTLKLPSPAGFLKPLAILYQEKWPSMVTSSLVEVTVVASKWLLHKLGILPHLKTLSFRYYADENAIQIAEETSDPFPSLTKLSIYAESLRDVTSVVRETGCLASSQIIITCTRTPTGYKVSRLFDAILERIRGRNIQFFSLKVQSDASGEVDEIDDVGDIFQDFIVTLDHFRPLFALNMRTLVVDVGYSLSVSNEQLEDLAFALPRLHILRLCSDREAPWSEFLPEHSVSLRGLQHLASLAYMTHATIELKIINDDLQSLPEAVSICPLRFLNVGGSDIGPEAIIPVGYFLAYLFPKLEKVVYSGEEDEMEDLDEDEDERPDDPSPWYRVTEVIKEVRAFIEGNLSESHPTARFSPAV